MKRTEMNCYKHIHHDWLYGLKKTMEKVSSPIGLKATCCRVTEHNTGVISPGFVGSTNVLLNERRQITI